MKGLERRILEGPGGYVGKFLVELGKGLNDLRGITTFREVLEKLDLVCKEIRKFLTRVKAH